jgi:hypothetical protein
MSKSKSFKLPLLGRFGITHDRNGSGMAGQAVFHTNLSVKVIDKDGNERKVRNYFGKTKIDRFFNALIYRNKTELDLGSGLVTTAGVRLLSQDTAVTAGTAALAAFKNHGSGTGTTAATVADTALQTAIGTTATAGTNTNALASPNATVTSTATVNYATTAAVTEWGLFNQTTLSGATMWDHKIFSAINVANGDSIQFTYTLTLTSGG